MVSTRCLCCAFSAVGPHDDWRRASLTAGSGASIKTAQPIEFRVHYIAGHLRTSLLPWAKKKHIAAEQNSWAVTVGRTHTIVRSQTRIRPKDGTENFGGFVFVLGL